MIVSTIEELPLTQRGYRPLKLKHPVFHIMFFIKEHPAHLINMPTLREAKELAESYYKQWLQVKKETSRDAE